MIRHWGVKQLGDYILLHTEIFTFKYLTRPTPISSKEVQFTRINVNRHQKWKQVLFRCKTILNCHMSEQSVSIKRYVLVCRLFFSFRRRRYRIRRFPTLLRFRSPPRDPSPASSSLKNNHQKYAHTERNFQAMAQSQRRHCFAPSVNPLIQAYGSSSTGIQTPRETHWHRGVSLLYSQWPLLFRESVLELWIR